MSSPPSRNFLDLPTTKESEGNTLHPQPYLHIVHIKVKHHGKTHNYTNFLMSQKVQRNFNYTFIIPYNPEGRWTT